MKRISILLILAITLFTSLSHATEPARGKADQSLAAANKKTATKKKSEVGLVVGENKATPVDRIKIQDGFQVELLYSVPGTEQGSWVAMCADDKGRLYVSDQYGGLFRFPIPEPGKPLDPKLIEKVPVDIRAINGMSFADGALYAGVNDYEHKIPCGFYKLTDSDGDDQLDKVELLREMQAAGDHGIHAVVPVPGSDDFYLVCGNRTQPTESIDESPVPKIWGEDHLLTRMPDGRGHNRTGIAPAGVIYQVTRDGKKFSMIACGFRNIYDASVNQAGELFTYDADMEWDMNTPWYRPTRVNHVVSGAEFGWRNGAGKRAEFYADNLPGTVNIGPGSPTGTTFGYGAKFPARFQQALFILDWSWGKIHAIHLQPEGASYTGVKEDFLSGMPLPVTDVIIHPQDGAMYFTIGGRRVQSGLYRVTYTGDEDTSPIKPERQLNAKAQLRHKLEAFHGHQDPTAVATAWPYLNDPDRHIRWAARTAIEHQPVETWKEKVFAEKDPARKLEAILALTRATGVCPYHRIPARPLGAKLGEAPEKTAKVPPGTIATPPVDTVLRDRILEAILAIDFNSLSEESQLTLIRTLQIVLNRFDGADEAMQKKLVAYLDPAFPAQSYPLNRLLCETLAYLQSPTVAAKGMALLQQSPSQEEQLEFARNLRFVTTGWNTKLRKEYLEWFLKAANYRGGASFDKFVEFIRNDALESLSAIEKAKLAELIAKKPQRVSVIENVGAIFAGRTPKEWTLEELSAAAKTGLKERNFENGRKMFAASACYSCHRFRDGGGMSGPDLTAAAGRYSPHDLLDQIVNPSKEINEQFSSIVAMLDDGRIVSGVVVNLNGNTMTINTDLTDPNQRVSVNRNEVESIKRSDISAMPTGLLNLLTEEEVLDLLAYVLSGGDDSNPMFAK